MRVCAPQHPAVAHPHLIGLWCAPREVSAEFMQRRSQLVLAHEPARTETVRAAHRRALSARARLVKQVLKVADGHVPAKVPTGRVDERPQAEDAAE